MKVAQGGEIRKFADAIEKSLKEAAEVRDLKPKTIIENLDIDCRLLLLSVRSPKEKMRRNCTTYKFSHQRSKKGFLVATKYRSNKIDEDRTYKDWMNKLQIKTTI